MKSISRKCFAFVSVYVLGCGGANFSSTNVPNAQEIAAKLWSGSQSDQVYSNDDSYKKVPEYWLGAVGAVPKTTSGDCAAIGTADAKLQWKGRIFATQTTPPAQPSANDLEQLLGYPLSAKETAPEMRVSSVITKDVAAKVAALSFVSAQLDASSVAEVIVTDIVTQRVAPSPKWPDAEANWIAANQSLVNDNNICYVLAVSGYTYKTLAKKIYRKMDAKMSGAYSGVNVGGSYYGSQQDYTLDHLFALSVDVLKRPPLTPTTTPTVAPSPLDRKAVEPKKNELDIFRRLRPESPKSFHLR